MASSGTTTGACSHCQNLTTTKCAGCRDAPVYDEVTHDTFYCGQACQKAHWDHHKTTCKALQHRKYLQRAASLLQQITFQIRLHACILSFDWARVEGSQIYVGGTRKPVPLANGLYIGPFSVPLEGDLFNAVLVNSACTEAMTYLYPFTKGLLTGLCSSIEEINIAVINPNLEIIQVHGDGTELYLRERSHNIYRVTLKNGEIWVLDPTGAQYGFKDPLRPWYSFEKRHISKTHEKHELGYIREDSVNSQFPLVRAAIAQKVEKEGLRRKIDEFIPVFAQRHGGFLARILKGSDSRFKEIKEEISREFEAHLKKSIDELSAPEELERRDKEVNLGLVRGFLNPSQQLDLESFKRQHMRE